MHNFRHLILKIGIKICIVIIEKMRKLLCQSIRLFSSKIKQNYSENTNIAQTLQSENLLRNNLPKYYANICENRGEQYYDYEGYNFPFG